MDLAPLDNKVAIVTGGTKGIGFAIAKGFLERGASVVVTSREESRAREGAILLEQYRRDESQQVFGFQFDLEDLSTISPLLESTIKTLFKIDILVNNAVSQNCLGPLNGFSEDQLVHAVNSNLTHGLLLMQAAYPYLKETSGNILNIGSVIVNRHLKGLPVYAIVKGALNQATKALAAEWGEDGIRVNGINPGFIRTQAFSDMGMPAELVEKNYAFYKNYCCLDTVGSPSDLESISSFLVSEEARFVTGSIINVDGGFSIQGVELYSEGT